MAVRPQLYQVIAQHKNAGNRVTLRALADAAEVSYSALWRWANGGTDYTNHHVLAVLCRELNCRPGDLLVYVPDADA